MARHDRAMLELLTNELAFLNQGDFGRSVSAPLPESAFQESPTCINSSALDGNRLCTECQLIDFVAHDHHAEVLPCRFIALNDAGETIEHLEAQGNQAKLDSTLRDWLRAKIKQLEDAGVTLDVRKPSASSASSH